MQNEAGCCSPSHSLSRLCSCREHCSGAGFSLLAPRLGGQIRGRTGQTSQQRSARAIHSRQPTRDVWKTQLDVLLPLPYCLWRGVLGPLTNLVPAEAAHLCGWEYFVPLSPSESFHLSLSPGAAVVVPIPSSRLPSPPPIWSEAGALPGLGCGSKQYEGRLLVVPLVWGEQRIWMRGKVLLCDHTRLEGDHLTH